MTKTFYLHCFALFFFATTSFLNAQTVPEVNAKALETTNQIATTIQLDKPTYNETQRAYVEYESRLASLEAIPGNPSYVSEMKKTFQILLQKRMKLAFNNLFQYFQYLLVTRQEDLSNETVTTTSLPTVELIGNTNQGPPMSAPTVTLYEN